MWKILKFSKKNLVAAIPILMAAGLAFGYFFDASFLKNAVLPLTFLMVYPMMVNLQISKIFTISDKRLSLAVIAMNFIIIPAAAFAIGNIFLADSPMAFLGLLLAALLPGSGMTISWTGLTKGNINASIKLMVLGLILGAAAVPFYIKLFMGAGFADVQLPLLGIITKILLIVFVPLILGYATRRIITAHIGEDRYKKELKDKFPLLSTLGVLGIVFTAIALRAKMILAEPQHLISLALPLLIFYLLIFATATLAGRLIFKRRDALSLVFSTSLRNLSIALAIGLTAFSDDSGEIALLLATAYIIQVQASAWYVKLIPFIFGKTEVEHEGITDSSTKVLAEERSDS